MTEIRDYAQHKPDCRMEHLSAWPWPTDAQGCSCGLDEALRRVEELENHAEAAGQQWDEAAGERDEALRRVEELEAALREIDLARAALAALDEGGGE